MPLDAPSRSISYRAAQAPEPAGGNGIDDARVTDGRLQLGAGTTRRELTDAAAHLRAVGEVLFFALPALIAPMLLLEYLIGTYHVHPLTVGGRYFPDGGFLFDLHVLWKAGHDIVTGHSPYPFVYPAPAAILMTPFGALPWTVAVAAFAVGTIAATVCALRVLGVRDWRCYGAALASLSSTAQGQTLARQLMQGRATAFRIIRHPRVLSRCL